MIKTLFLLLCLSPNLYALDYRCSNNSTHEITVRDNKLITLDLEGEQVVVTNGAYSRFFDEKFYGPTSSPSEISYITLVVRTSLKGTLSLTRSGSTEKVDVLCEKL